MHNWRVASFVNNATIAEGQYGWPVWSGFSPAYNLRAWQNADGLIEDDVVAMPAAVSIGPSQSVRDTVFKGARTFHGTEFPLTLAPLGSAYWVFRADPALPSGAQDLVVRVSAPEGYAMAYANRPVRMGFRLMATVLGYSIPDSTDGSVLWRHPEAITFVSPAKWIDTDSVRAGMEFSIPDFGGATKSALLVLSLGDTHGIFNSMTTVFYEEAQPYRIEAHLRRMAEGPEAFAVSAALGMSEVWPAWAPRGDKIAYTKWPPGEDVLPALPWIYWRNVTGGTQTGINPGSSGLIAAQYPDWSPRGDRIAFEGLTSTTASNIWSVNPTAANATPSRLTNLSGRAIWPAFQPDGQGVAYVRMVPGGQSWELRHVSLNGTNDRLLTTLPVLARVQRPRWDPAGMNVWIVLNDEKLYCVSKQGGALIPAPLDASPLRELDFHAGDGRLLVETTDSLKNNAREFSIYGVYYSAGKLPADRYALVDTTSSRRDTSYILFPTSDYADRDPVYAPDGTRIAFTRFASGAVGGADVYAARISPNHAPTLQAVADKNVPACAPLSLQLVATDPDGEAITYRADELPPGATLSASGAFSWVPTVVGTYWGVFRAMDGSSGVDTRVVKFAVYDAGGCGDPIGEGGGEGIIQGHHAQPMLARSMGGAGTQVANTLLDGAESGAWAERTVRLMATSIDKDGRVVTTLGAHGAGPVELDRVQMLVIDHPETTSAFATPSGVVVGARVPAATLSIDGGADVTALLTGGNGEPLPVPPGSTLLAGVDAESRGVVVECARIGGEGSTDSSEVLVEAFTGGVWQDAGRIYPRRSRDTLAVMTGTATQVRMTPRGQLQLWAIDGFLPTDAGNGAVVASTLDLASASDPEAQPALLAADTATVVLEPSQSLTLGFDPPAQAEGRRRSYFLTLRGKYDAGLGALMAKRQVEASSLPVRFALHANRPNPFSRTTTLRYDLPIASQVRIEVFDAQGRRVTTLVNGEQAAGARTLVWTGATEGGASAPAGVYFARMIAGSFRAQRRMVLLGR